MELKLLTLIITCIINGPFHNAWLPRWLGGAWWTWWYPWSCNSSRAESFISPPTLITCPSGPYTTLPRPDPLSPSTRLPAGKYTHVHAGYMYNMDICSRADSKVIESLKITVVSLKSRLKSYWVLKITVVSFHNMDETFASSCVKLKATQE